MHLLMSAALVVMPRHEDTQTMIDIATEQLIPLTQAARLVPPGHGGRKTHISTLLRWISPGVRLPGGQLVRLEALRVGSRWCTSSPALQRFFEALTPTPTGGSGPEMPRSSAARQRASERAGKELERMGL
jgi:hypothetical protein